MQVASNPAAGASWPGPEAAPAPAPAQPEPVIGQAASAAADGGSSFANAMLMRDGGRPASNAAWGNPEFAMAPGGQALGVAQMAGPAQAGTFIGYTKPLLLDPPARMFADLPAPSYSGQAMEAFHGRILPRNDDERGGSPGEQDIFSGQQGSGDNDHVPGRPVDEGPYPPGKDGTPLRMSDAEAAEYWQSLPEDARPPSAEPANPAAPVDPAAPVAATDPAAAVGPKADPTEIAALEMVLADPANKEMVEHFGGELKPLPTWTSNGKGIEARYGADLGGRLYQLQLAQRAVEGEFFQAMDDAQRSPPKDPLPDYHRPNQPVPTTDRPGWTYSAGGGHADDWQAPHWVYSKELFARQYAAGDSPAQRAFASLHGTDPIKFVPAADTETASQDSWQMSGLTVREGRPVDREDGLTPASSIVKDGWLPSGLERRDYHLDPNRITKLINNEAVWFDPVHGFSTDPDNLKPDALDRAMPYVFAAAVTAMTFGAGSTVAAGIASAAGGGASGTVAVGAAMGAVSNGAMQLAANGKINFGQLLQSAVAGGLTAGMTKLPGVGEYLDVGGKSFGGRLMAYTGRATVQGAIQAVAGGKFKDGFASGLMSGLAGEVTAQIDTQIGQMQGLSASEASALRLLSRATGSAMRLAGSKDPASGFASDFLGGLMHDGLAAHQPNTDAAGSAPPADPLGEFIAGNDQQRGMRQAVADLLDQTLDNAESPNNRTLLAAADSSFLPESVGRSIDFGRGFVEGGGISILQSGAALWSLASHPGQFIEGVQALLTSADARGQLAQEVLRGVQTDIQMFRDAYDAGDMRVAGQQFGKLTTDLAQMVGGVEALVRMAPSLARGVGRGANAVAGVFEDTLAGSGSGTRGLGVQRGSVGVRSPDAVTGVASVETGLFRGGNSLRARLGTDVRLAEDGLIHPLGSNGRPQGLSLNLDPLDPFVQRYGGAYPVNAVPEGLNLVQSGKPSHFVVAPSVPMTFERYQTLLNNIILGNFNKLP